MKLLVINGVNLNMLGIREPDIYGKKTYADLEEYIKLCANMHSVDIVQYNSEEKIVEEIQRAYQNYDFIIINPGAFTHYSYAIYDAIKAVGIKTIEVHLSDICGREEFRRISVIKDACICQIKGFGFESYKKAIEVINTYE